ncbi:cytochrome c oxidase subunit 4 [Rhizobium binae]|uniref:Cytochrome c oxidase subunit 4 n=1 Tax=Rhizobium binae TaxID=1138190 RepID=A0ABV2MPR4_9HYPH|nr:cytochrome C oxidase subunit IV family protein [Rhizobium binae]MBX4970042.1 caa(3)-type oxidase subunit IV [Rhizobium binae]MBX4994925.1 caa(3)-type oxidase subunit IV [Rhizobium binae]NKL52535.1 caa(3)-type oxidase subunit IV [Rhizobium leguminosarum bv. viciae]QSY85012.1 cytochrome C oxidase subunit IV family protein [Rhizobium binae]
MTKTASILLVWAALLMLLGMTVAASTLLSGAIGLAVGLSIALVKTGLVSWRYMHLDEQPGLARLAAFGAAAWLTILFSLAGLDYLTR